MSWLRRFNRAEANPHDSDLLPIYGTKVACNGLRSSPGSATSVGPDAEGSPGKLLPDGSEGEELAETVWVQIRIFFQSFGYYHPPLSVVVPSNGWQISC